MSYRQAASQSRRPPPSPPPPPPPPSPPPHASRPRDGQLENTIHNNSHISAQLVSSKAPIMILGLSFLAPITRPYGAHGHLDWLAPAHRPICPARGADCDRVPRRRDTAHSGGDASAHPGNAGVHLLTGRGLRTAARAAPRLRRFSADSPTHPAPTVTVRSPSQRRMTPGLTRRSDPSPLWHARSSSVGPRGPVFLPAPGPGVTSDASKFTSRALCVPTSGFVGQPVHVRDTSLSKASRSSQGFIHSSRRTGLSNVKTAITRVGNPRAPTFESSSGSPRRSARSRVVATDFVDPDAAVDLNSFDTNTRNSRATGAAHHRTNRRILPSPSFSTMTATSPRPAQRYAADKRRAIAQSRKAAVTEKKPAPSRVPSRRDPAWWPSIHHPTFARSSSERRKLFYSGKYMPKAPWWRFVMLSDGHIGRHLRVLTRNTNVRVQVMESTSLESAELLPPETHRVGPYVHAIPGPRWRRRQVRLVDATGTVLLHATSWWSEVGYDAIFAEDETRLVWDAIDELQIGTARKILGVEYGECKELHPVLGCEGPFWSRHYVFYRNQSPFVVIDEVFSKSLETYLGAMPKPAPELDVD